MSHPSHLYIYNYDHNLNDLCKLESKYLFGDLEAHKFLFSNKRITPSCSAFIKKRLDILTSSEDYDTLLANITAQQIHIEGFKIEYLVLHNDSTGYEERLQKIRDIGHCITGEAQYKNPSITYGLCLVDEKWYFGSIEKNSFDWHKHKQKPLSFSNSLDMSIAKSLLNIASKGYLDSKLLDICCGVGTVLLEGAFAGYNVIGCDINPKIVGYANKNLAHFKYTVPILNMDIKNVDTTFDAAMIDLPYNLFTKVSDDTHAHIINGAAQITNQLVIVSTTDISKIIKATGFTILDHCTVAKKGKKNFARIVWVCERD